MISQFSSKKLLLAGLIESMNQSNLSKLVDECPPFTFMHKIKIKRKPCKPLRGQQQHRPYTSGHEMKKRPHDKRQKAVLL